MRRLLALVSAVVFVDAMLFTALTPLVPGYAEEFDLSKTGAGLLVGSFGAGALLGGIPGGIAAARFGPKVAVVGGLLVLAVASFAFAAADSAIALGAARFVQGFSSTTTWAGALAWVTVAAPLSKRGEVIGTAFGAAVMVWVGFLILRHFSSAAGPGTSTADLPTNLAGNNLLQIAERLCLDPEAIAAGAGRLFTLHWPELFGLERQPLTDFGIESVVQQGLPLSAWLLVPAFGIPAFRLVASRVSRRVPTADGPRPTSAEATAGKPTSDLGFCAFLILVAAFSLVGYLVGRCGLIDFHTMRYELLSVLGAVGLAGWYLRVERSRAIGSVWALSCAAIFAISIAGHGRLLAEYATGRQPIALKQELIRELEARNIRYAYADYWTAYYVSFMTRERIIVASDEVMKVKSHNRLVDAHRGEAIRISRRPCPGGQQITSAFWSCSP